MLQFEKLDYGEANVLHTFYNADVAVVDLSLQWQQSALSYHLGIRESFNMKENILLYNDCDIESTLRLKVCCYFTSCRSGVLKLYNHKDSITFQVSWNSHTFVSYKLIDNRICVITNPAAPKCKNEDYSDPKLHLSLKMKQIFEEVEIQSKCVYN